ncbi:hypothetical protein [Leptolyngbya sp. PCC 6406]|uniref:hypothetical protein n=1 Tax=Leptolyngbya sp. PCC 6406 TaxID=1173264 RepID=UPI0002AC7929|nr:hypothetical protein [Leptolyngbya sp. PCC 6406]
MSNFLTREEVLIVDGNKRTAFAVMDTFLRVNGYRLMLADDAAFDLVIRVVQGQIDKAGVAEELADAVV